MPLTFNRRPGAGETRACTDPWEFLIIRATGDVSLCCRSEVVGNLEERSLDSILEGPEAQAMRRGLLTGDLCPACLRCAERGVSSIDELRREVRALVGRDGTEVEQLRIHVRELREVRSDLMRERAALWGHVGNLEQGRSEMRKHIESLEAERSHFLGHIENLEKERPHLFGHIANLEAERPQLLGHIETTNAERQHLLGHIANLEAERSRFLEHIENLRRDLQDAKSLEARGRIGRAASWVRGLVGRMRRRAD